MNRRRRQGFTLVEMLIVMAIMLLLMAIGVAFLPGMYQRTNTPISAQMLQKELVKVRMLAIRDRRICGVQFAQSSAVGGTQYDQYFATEQLDDLSAGTATTTAGSNVVTLGGGFSASGLSLTQPGDAIEIDGVGVPHLIQSISGAQLTLASSISYTSPASSFRILRNNSGGTSSGNQQEFITFPGGAVVDLAYSTNSSAAASAGAFPPGASLAAPLSTNILFSPSGGVTLAPVGVDRYIFYVRDSNVSSPLAGQPMLVVVYVRTGLVAIQPVNLTVGGNPFSQALQPQPSGL